MPPVSRVRASFRLSGETLDPSLVTRQLGIFPTHAHAKGDPHMSRGQRITDWSMGAWVLQSSVEKGESLEDHLVALLDLLAPEAVRSLTLLGYDADFFCGLFLEHLNEGLVLTPETLGRIAALGAKLSLDIYEGSQNGESGGA